IESPDFYHDQTYTEKALERYQEFLDDFPGSPYKNEVLSSIRILRNKVGEKEFETGILYMKMEEYESARMVFQRVDNLYYDTDVVDDTKLWIIKAYAKDLNLEAANQHLADYETVLKASELYDDALASIAEAEKKIAKETN
ncbi:MAG: outer membrane protein assembly factor BamD, partial [Candidatus Marinimicrobia bacterium]|nr:outer membrane protein assembly factor BamD [Candidatus Neomarinimicrobiota bacterium]